MDETTNAQSKKCTKCGEEKSLDFFYFQKNKYNGGLGSWCKKCVCLDRKRFRIEHPKLIALRKKEYREQHREELKIKSRFRHKHCGIKRRYGLTAESFDALRLSQDNACAICGKKFVEDGLRTNYGVDHCHRTRKVRGLLCRSCNVVLGLVKESVNILSKMIEYLESHE